MIEVMPMKNERQSVLAREIKIVPWLAWALGAISFAVAQWYFNIEMVRLPHPPPAWARPSLGILAGGCAAAYLLLIGYVNRDSKRRGMSPTLWTLVAIFVPNLLGILLYFVLRHPLIQACPQCGSAVEAGFNFCPRCSYKLAPSCPQCQRIVSVSDAYCPFCGAPLRTDASQVSGSPTTSPG